MSITLNTKTYTSYRVLPDTIIYAGPANSVSKVDTVSLRRIFPKPTKDNKGVARPIAKTVKSLTLADGSIKDMIVETTSSVPVGAVDADVLLVLDDHADLLDTQDVKDLYTKLDINA